VTNEDKRFFLERLWRPESQEIIGLLLIANLSDSLLCIDRLVGMLPLVTLSKLTPSLFITAVSKIADMVLFSVHHVIAPKTSLAPLAPLLINKKMERSKDLKSNQVRASREEYANYSRTS
jgi:hypothetical protein